MGRPTYQGALSMGVLCQVRTHKDEQEQAEPEGTKETMPGDTRRRRKWSEIEHKKDRRNVRRCLAHHAVDCFDCINPVQSTQLHVPMEERFECVEVENGHE